MTTTDQTIIRDAADCMSQVDRMMLDWAIIEARVGISAGKMAEEIGIPAWLVSTIRNRLVALGVAERGLFDELWPTSLGEQVSNHYNGAD